MTEDMNTRILKMFQKDVLFAYGFVAGLWAVYLFVFYRVMSLIGSGSIVTVLLISGALVLLFNTAAIVAMIRHYAHEKETIYGLDIRHLDEMALAKKNQ